MHPHIPARLSPDGRTATWNPALTRATFVWLHMREADGNEARRRSLNSGRARVREAEAILAVYADAEPQGEG